MVLFQGNEPYSWFFSTNFDLHSCELVQIVEQILRIEPKENPVPAWKLERSFHASASNLILLALRDTANKAFELLVQVFAESVRERLRDPKGEAASRGPDENVGDFLKASTSSADVVPDRRPASGSSRKSLLFEAANEILLGQFLPISRLWRGHELNKERGQANPLLWTLALALLPRMSPG
jgi:hypothetical protein